MKYHVETEPTCYRLLVGLTFVEMSTTELCKRLVKGDVFEYFSPSESTFCRVTELERDSEDHISLFGKENLTKFNIFDVIQERWSKKYKCYYKGGEFMKRTLSASYKAVNGCFLDCKVEDFQAGDIVRLESHIGERRHKIETGIMSEITETRFAFELISDETLENMLSMQKLRARINTECDLLEGTSHESCQIPPALRTDSIGLPEGDRSLNS